MNCPKCNNLILSNASFCTECGLKFSSTTIQKGNKKSFCRNCSKQIEVNAFACDSCGLPPMKGKSYCNSCGEPTHPEAILCIKCGAKLSNNLLNISNINLEKNYNNTGFWGSIITIIAFFLTWGSAPFGLVEFTGFGLATKFLTEFAPLRFVLIAIPIISIYIFYCIVKEKYDNYFEIIKVMPLIMMVLTFIIGYYYLHNTTSMFSVLTFGFYLSLIGSGLLATFKNKKS